MILQETNWIWVHFLLKKEIRTLDFYVICNPNTLWIIYYLSPMLRIYVI